jgi:DNA primase
VLAPHCGATPEHVSLAMLALREILTARGIGAIPVLDGFVGAALFVPFADAPAYGDVRAWLHVVANAAVFRNANLLTTDEHEHQHPRVHVNVGSNAVGRFSSLPYALIGSPQLGMVTPIEWTEVGIVHNGHYTAENSADRLSQGDVFQRLATPLAAQRFGAGPR